MMRFSFPFLFSAAITGCTALANNFELKYFDARGAAEASRLLLAIAGEDYKDTRYGIIPGKMESPDFNKAKESGALAMNLDRAPVLITPDGITIGQSRAMERYLARRFGLMGGNDADSSLIDCITEHCRDVKDAQMRKRFSVFVRDRSDEEKAVDQKEWFDEEMPALLAKMENSVRECGGSEGCAVGKSISYADVCVYLLLKEPFPAYEEVTLTAAKDCPRLLAISDAVANHPGVRAWVDKRPETNF